MPSSKTHLRVYLVLNKNNCNRLITCKWKYKLNPKSEFWAGFEKVCIKPGHLQKKKKIESSANKNIADELVVLKHFL